MAPQKTEQVTVEDGRIIFRNFAGKGSDFNRPGDRNFGLLLDPETAMRMQEVGWNVKFLKKREDDDPDTPQQAWIEVKVSYKGRPPRAFMLSSRGRTALDEDMIDMLDMIDIQENGVDVIINPYHWDVNGNQGISAYLQSIYVKVREDALDLKYQDYQDVASPSQYTIPEPTF